jgi:hypothetical protein
MLLLSYFFRKLASKHAEVRVFMDQVLKSKLTPLQLETLLTGEHIKILAGWF